MTALHLALLSHVHAATQLPGPPMLVDRGEVFSWNSLISQTAFPIAVSGYLLWMLDKRLMKILATLERITEIMRYKRDDEEKE